LIEQDRNFDDLAQRFARNIYGSAKGEIRLAIVWQHLRQVLDMKQPLRILDAGCGFGQLARRLAGLGHELVLTDPSKNMLDHAEREFAADPPAGSVRFVHAPIQELSRDEFGRFDLVLCHAVLEWLAQPKQTLHQLLDLIRPGGHLSLMFYNKDALIFRNLIRGNWRKVESGVLQGEEGGLTPYHPLSLHEVESWLQEWHMPVIARAGVRVIHDYMEKQLRDSRPVEETVRMEMQYAQQEPYLYLGRYLHVVARKSE
jgi:S-adenosylmethionine-dependent methyltransferase